MPEENIVIEKQSGKDFRRPRYQRLIGTLRQADVLVVQEHRPAGAELHGDPGAVSFITKERGSRHRRAGHAPAGHPAGQGPDRTLIADIVLQLLSYVAQTERENIRRRQAEGIAAARARGGLLGRERIELPEDFQDLAELWQEGGISSRNAARELGISLPDLPAQGERALRLIVCQKRNSAGGFS